MSFVIRRQGRADHVEKAELAAAMIAGTTIEALYLVWSDPNAKNGKGAEGWTMDIAKAKRFATRGEAMECWKAQSTIRPLRPDGRPNRPMTAYHVTIEPAP